MRYYLPAAEWEAASVNRVDWPGQQQDESALAAARTLPGEVSCGDAGGNREWTPFNRPRHGRFERLFQGLPNPFRRCKTQVQASHEPGVRVQIAALVTKPKV